MEFIMLFLGFGFLSSTLVFSCLTTGQVTMQSNMNVKARRFTSLVMYSISIIILIFIIKFIINL